MMQPDTLVRLLEVSAACPKSITYLESEHDRRSVPFAQLHQRALGILHHLQRRGVRRGDKLIVFLQQNQPFIEGFWAAILGGIVPVPVALGISDEHRNKLLRIAQQLGDPWLYTDGKTLERIVGFALAAGDTATANRLRTRAILIDDIDDLSTAGTPASVSPADIAFIQFSSGSTSDPKGVVLTHANLIANTQGAAQSARFSSDDACLSWMPLTHDMGLIGLHIFELASGMNLYQMPTELFVRRPLLWMEFASRERATVLGSPNFGYRHFLKVLGDRSLTGLDLSAVRIIFNGAEPISAQLCREFTARLAAARLPACAIYPVYGLAEATVAVSFPEPCQPLQTLTVDRHSLATGQRPRTLASDHRDALELVALGSAIPNCELRIADDTDAALSEGHCGHIQIRGSNVTAGYFENSAANASVRTGDGWLRTGDLGLLQDGQIYVTGRAKEIIFVNGQNYYPYDLERIAQQAPGMELGKVVVSGVRRRGSQTDEIVVFVLHRTDLSEFLPTAMQVAQLLNEKAGLEVAAVVPVKRIPKTTSGKVQRHLLEQDYVEGTFDTELAALRQLRSAATAQTTEACTAIEANLKRICSSALDGKTVGIDDSLFDLGASSLKLIEIHEQLDAEYPGQLDLTELFDFPSIRQLALHLEKKLALGA